MGGFDHADSILENIHAAVVLHAPDTSIISANAKARELLGLDDTDPRGKKIEAVYSSFISENGQPLPEENHPVRRVLKNKKPLSNQIVGIVNPSTSKTVWVVMNTGPIRDDDGGLSGVVVIFTDITWLKQTEEAHLESLDRYRSLIHHFKGIVFRYSLDFKPIFLYGAVEEITGYTEQEFLIGNPAWNRIILREDIKNYLAENISGLTQKPGHVVEREYRIVRRDGETRWVLEIMGNVCDETGKPAFIQGAIHDISERKRAEKSLNNRITELTLLNTVNRLVQADTSRDEMVRGVTKGLAESLAPDLVILYLMEGREMVIQSM